MEQSSEPKRVHRLKFLFHARGIRNRWLRNSFLAVTVGIFVVAVILSSVLVAYYYNSVQAGLENKANTAAGFFGSYAASESEYLEMAAYYIADFDEKNTLELQFLTVEGEPRVYLSSNGLSSGSKPGTVDITAAIESGLISPWNGRDPSTGEHILAVSAPILNNGEVKGVLRLVSSLRLVDRQIFAILLVIAFVGLLFIFLIYLLNASFVRSIIVPMADLTDTAKRIASGYYGIQIEKEYDDEIGDLTDAINEMSLAISRNEQMKSEFISSVSHELRTPLTAINGWGETLLSGKLDSAQDYRKGMRIIVSESKRLTKMVEELLEFSRIQDGRFNLNIEMIDIQAEFEDAVYTYQEFYKKEGITLNYTMPEQEFEPIPGDPERLRQVFSNLLDNAAKHGGAGKRIDTTIGEEEGYVAIVIRDYGPGIPPDDLPHVKEKFYKGASKARGNGIGLAVCEEIVTRHGGRLDIENGRDGVGCVVTILLPRKAPQVTTDSAK